MTALEMLVTKAKPKSLLKLAAERGESAASFRCPELVPRALHRNAQRRKSDAGARGVKALSRLFDVCLQISLALPAAP